MLVYYYKYKLLLSYKYLKKYHSGYRCYAIYILLLDNFNIWKQVSDRLIRNIIVLQNIHNKNYLIEIIHTHGANRFIFLRQKYNNNKYHEYGHIWIYDNIVYELKHYNNIKQNNSILIDYYNDIYGYKILRYIGYFIIQFVILNGIYIINNHSH